MRTKSKGEIIVFSYIYACVVICLIIACNYCFFNIIAGPYDAQIDMFLMI